MEISSPALQAEKLRLLLLDAAQSLSSGDTSEVQRAAEELTRMAASLRPAFGELFPNPSGLAPMEVEQQRRRLLLPLLEARAFYLAGLRRWRRCLHLRRSLIEMKSDAPAYGEAELSRWC
jgi:hypothetical protein